MSHAVVIVNWNGADDTIACLESFLGRSPAARAIVVDNGSSDRSVERISDALQARGVDVERLRDGARAAATEARVLIVEESDNLGFAGGCNVGLRVAAAAGIATVVFLNNDTVVEGDALDRIVARLHAEPGCFACLPMLVVCATDRVWNCGGSAFRIGLRRYHCGGWSRADATRRGEIRCSFFTGCCFAVRTDDFVRRGGFSERFFFGEEDFELALWMKDRGLSAVCLTTAVVRHKVSASFDRASASAARRVFVYYLNRFIHMRLRFGTAWWRLWATAYLPYAVALLLRRRVIGIAECSAFVRQLWRMSRTLDRVTRSDFEALMRGRAW